MADMNNIVNDFIRRKFLNSTKLVEDEVLRLDDDDAFALFQSKLTEATTIWAIIVKAIIVLLASVAFLCGWHTLINVVCTLAMVERSTKANSETKDVATSMEVMTDDAIADQERGRLLPESDVPSTAITSSIRGTLAHLRRVAGVRRGYLRGAPHRLCAFILSRHICRGLSLIIPAVLGEPLGRLVSALLLCPFRAASTLAIISTTPKSFFGRFPPVSAWKHLLLPAALCAVVEYLLILGPAHAALALDIEQDLPHQQAKILLNGDLDAAQKGTKLTILLGKSVCLILLYFLAAVLHVVPLSALTRIEASLLPETENTIVVLDPVVGQKGAGQYNDEMESRRSIGKPIGVVESLLSVRLSTLLKVSRVIFKACVLVGAIGAVIFMVVALFASLTLKDLSAIISRAASELALQETSPTVLKATP